jgi:hypothetical protein
VVSICQCVNEGYVLGVVICGVKLDRIEGFHCSLLDCVVGGVSLAICVSIRDLRWRGVVQSHGHAS